MPRQNETPLLSQVNQANPPQIVKDIGGSTVNTLGSGSIVLTDGNHHEVTIDNILFVPLWARTRISS
jgi:hypothetical protein